MSYKALYLTYRPQTFEEVAGQKPIVRTLKNALASKKMAHAYLFAGPRGTGKTSMARLFAKALNCDEGLGNQCGHCQNCMAISEGNHPDVIEIDAASNNGVDQVRELIDGVRYSPIKGRYKVYIIDEVHMMSTGAFNALLKTIEEPPENVIFILCTTEPFKVLPTILSRCQRFDFSKLSEDEMGDKLKEILAKENVEYDEEGVKSIIALADGGMRDALSILDQVLAYSGNKLSEEDVLSVYGLASKEEKIDLLKSLRQGDAAKVIAKSDSYLAKGLDIRRFVSELIAILKDLLVYIKTKRADLLDVLKENEAVELSSFYSSSVTNATIQKLLETQNNFKMVSDIRSLFELALLELTSDPNVPQETDKNPKISGKTPSDIHPIPDKKIETPTEEKTIKPLFENKHEAGVPLPSVTPSNNVGTSVSPSSGIKKTESPIQTNQPHEKVPEWLWEEKKVAVDITSSTVPQAPSSSIDASKIKRPQIATQGERFSIPEEEIINVMVLANKSERKALIERWNELAALKIDEKVGALASLLSSGAPYCLSKEALILVYKHKALAGKANIVANQEPLQELLETLLGRRVFVYSLDNSEKVAIQNRYYSLMQVNQLPDKNSIVLKLPK